MFEVRSKFLARDNGSVGPFEKRGEAERALIALCQSGQATSGDVVELEEDKKSACSKNTRLMRPA